MNFFAQTHFSTLLPIGSFRAEFADYFQAFIFVYTLCVLAWIVMSIVFSLGMRVPYIRWLNAILDFLRDVSEPYLALFRKLPLRAGPFDFSPIVALLVLQLGGAIIVRLITP